MSPCKIVGSAVLSSHYVQSRRRTVLLPNCFIAMDSRQAQLDLSSWSEDGSVRKIACGVAASTERNLGQRLPLLQVAKRLLCHW
jgi:hypothetical protein